MHVSRTESGVYHVKFDTIHPITEHWRIEKTDEGYNPSWSVFKNDSDEVWCVYSTLREAKDALDQYERLGNP